MTTQILERPVDARDREHAMPMGESVASRFATLQTEALTSDFDIEAELSMLATSTAEFVADRGELGQKIMQSAMSAEYGSFAVKCRSVSHATEFATQMRCMLLTPDVWIRRHQRDDFAVIEPEYLAGHGYVGGRA